LICRGITFESDKLRILCYPHSDYRNPEDQEDEAKCRREEDIYAAREVLGRLIVYQWPQVPPVWVGTDVTKTWQNYLMYLLTPVSRHYGVDKDRVLDSFVRNYMPSILLSNKHAVPEGSDRLAFQMMDSMDSHEV
jgi:hypothetical protein